PNLVITTWSILFSPSFSSVDNHTTDPRHLSGEKLRGWHRILYTAVCRIQGLFNNAPKGAHFMFRNKLKLKFLGIILVLLFVVTGCLGGPAKRVEQTADEVEVQRLHELIFTAEDLQSLLHHLADPFALGGGRAWGEQEPEMKWETYTHQEAMNFQQDTGARFPLPLGPPPEGWTMLDPAVMVNGEHATVSQIAETV